MSLISPKLLEILVCPACHAALQEDEAASVLRCTGCGLSYAVVEGIPNMLIEDATKPEQATTPQAA